MFSWLGKLFRHLRGQEPVEPDDLGLFLKKPLRNGRFAQLMKDYEERDKRKEGGSSSSPI